MKRLRVLYAVFFVWLFLLYNIERLHKPINLASFVYVLAAATAVPFLVLGPWSRIPAIGLLIATAPLTIVIKASLGYELVGAQLPLTITEIVAVAVTAGLALQIGRSLHDLRASVLNTLLIHLHDRSQSFDQGQAELYREVRRARKHRRPLALLAISVADHSIHHSLDRFTAEFHRECVEHYISARVAELLSVEMKDCSVISHHGEQFVTVVPEADRETAQLVAEKLKRIAHEKLGLQLCIGVSSFPDEEVTLVELLERATAQRKAGESLPARAEPAPIPAAPPAATAVPAPLSRMEDWPSVEVPELREAM